MQEDLIARKSGILLPITALPSRYGIGTLGSEAYNFVDFLEKSKQHYWQVLPLGPTGYGDSPYQSCSTYAINPYYIDLTTLEEEGWLTHTQLRNSKLDTPDGTPIDYGKQFSTRVPLLKNAAARFIEKAGEEEQSRFSNFERENSFWLDDYALFMVLKEKNNNVAFTKWDDNLRLRDPAAISRETEENQQEIRLWKVIQYWCAKQWRKLKEYANAHGISIIGDIPIYVSPDSSDLWTHPELFQTNEDGTLTAVAGCPPDAFSADGQLWGNPLYDWEYHKKTGFEWWISRLAHVASLFDVVRIDHFRGFSGYYSIPASSPTAATGHWEDGPGSSFISSIKAALPNLKIIAEDLGYLTDDVRSLLAESGYPGMKVLQFAFDSREQSDYLPHNYPKHCVVYTGTHDNTTTQDWISSAPNGDVLFAYDYLAADPNTFTAKLIRAAMGSVANTAIIPMQDWLGLGKEGRINTPSTIGANWVWRMNKAALTENLAKDIAHVTVLFGRK